MPQCYLCQSKSLTVIQEKLRHNIKRRVFRCEGCGLVFLDSQQKNLQKFYQKEYRNLYSSVLGKETSVQEFFDIYVPLQEGRVEKIKHLLNSSMRVLDVGSSAGQFLHAIRPYVQECIGVEFDEVYAQFANDNIKIKTYTKPLEQTDLEPYSFDMISALEVLEHIEDPLKFLNTIKQYLKPDGFVYIEVPNHNDSLLSVFDVSGYRDFYYRQPHLFYYNPKTFKKIMARAGFYGAVSSSGFEPNIINQFNWMITNQPQPSATIAYGKPMPQFLPNSSLQLQREYAHFLKTMDNEYKNFLNRHLICSHLAFIGQQK